MLDLRDEFRARGCTSLQPPLPSAEMTHAEDSGPVRLDAREHLVHGRVRASTAPATGDSGENVLVPLEAELRLVRGGSTLGATRTHADGSYTLLFTDANLKKNKKRKTKSKRERADLWLHVLNGESDPCKRVNFTQRCSFALEFDEVADAESSGSWMWQQTLEIDFRDAFPECPLASQGAAPEWKTSFQGLQAHEFREALLEIGRQAVGEFPLSLGEAAIALCYSVFFALLCALLCASRRHREDRRSARLEVVADPSAPRTLKTSTCSARNHTNWCRVHRFPATRQVEKPRPTTRTSNELHVIGSGTPRPAPVSSKATQTPDSISTSELGWTGGKKTWSSGRAW